MRPIDKHLEPTENRDKALRCLAANPRDFVERPADNCPEDSDAFLKSWLVVGSNVRQGLAPPHEPGTTSLEISAPTTHQAKGIGHKKSP